MTSRRLRIYVAGPCTNGNTLTEEAIALNADRAAQVGAELLKHGFAPMLPQLTAGHPCLMAVHWAFWIEAGCAWIAISDAVLRLSGESKGTDAEIAFASQRGVPVFTSLGDLIEWRERQLDLEAVHCEPGEIRYEEGPVPNIPGMIQPPEPWPDPSG